MASGGARLDPRARLGRWIEEPLALEERRGLNRCFEVAAGGGHGIIL